MKDSMQTINDLTDSFNNVVSGLTQQIKAANKETAATGRSFEQKIIHASMRRQEGDPMKNFLTREEEEIAINLLAGIYKTLGHRLPS